jgi:hypothetical protein
MDNKPHDKPHDKPRHNNIISSGSDNSLEYYCFDYNFMDYVLDYKPIYKFVHDNKSYNIQDYEHRL